MRGATIFWQALEAARWANLRDAGEALPVPGSDGETRRHVLKALAATGVVAALPRVARAAPVSGKVVIIGGGIAGLSALWQLTEAGVDAHLYEARTRLGGPRTPRDSRHSRWAGNWSILTMPICTRCAGSSGCT